MIEVFLFKLILFINGVFQNEVGWENYGYDYLFEFFMWLFSDGIFLWKNINNLCVFYMYYQMIDDIYVLYNIMYFIDL